MQDNRYFYGLYSDRFTMDRLYRIYITPDCLSGAYVAGLVYDKKMAKYCLEWALYYLLSGYVERVLQRRAKRELIYDKLDPTSDWFLSEDHFNFHIDRIQIDQLILNPNRSSLIPENVGTFIIHQCAGTVSKFILIDDQDFDLIAEELEFFCAVKNESGKPVFHQIEKAVLRPEDRSRLKLVSAALYSIAFLLLIYVISTLGWLN